MARDDEGQMMVLTAVILMAAFLALTAMLARAGDLAAETSRESSDPFAAEVAALERGLVRIAAGFDHQDAGSDLEAVVAHMERVSAQRGYWVDIAVGPCTASTQEFTVHVQTADVYARKVVEAAVVSC